MEAEINSTVVIPCALKGEDGTKVSTIEWAVNGTTDVHLYRDNHDSLTEQAENYRGRTSLPKEEFSKGNFSLILRTEPSHAGTYLCTVKIGPEKYNCSSELICKYNEQLKIT